MISWKYFLSFLFIILTCDCDVGTSMDTSVIATFVARLVKTRDAIIFSCSGKDLQHTALALMNHNQFVYPVNMNSSYSLRSILTTNNFARTSVILNTGCQGSTKLLAEASAGRYFNKTYQWLLWGIDRDINQLLPIELDYIGPNAQITYVNKSHDVYNLWDIHSKGRHLKAKIEVHLIARVINNKLDIVSDIFELQSTRNRGQFNGLTLRGATVIDQDDIITNDQIEAILSRPTKDPGVAALIKYHYELVVLLRDRLNFTVNFRNARGWGGRLGNTTFRVGLLGIMMRNEADIAASGSLNRINRFALFDTIHKSWKFDTAFIYRFTPDLDSHGGSGNFLAPFTNQVWVFALSTMIAINLTWIIVEWINQKWNNGLRHLSDLVESGTGNQSSWTEVALQTIGAICQQGMDPIPRDLPSRFIAISVFIFSLVMYNYYTSSVVGGLLSSSEHGPATVDEITSSPLKISFEDIGYYKVLFRESTKPLVLRLINQKLSSARKATELPVFTHIEEAMPYLKNGGFAFHCEVVAAYPIIAEIFDANEICDLREVSGLMEVEILNWIVPKNSQYSEVFKTAMCNVRETGLVERFIRLRQIKKPPCQSLYTVYPVSISGVLSAFFILMGAALLSILILCLELAVAKAGPFKRVNLLKQKLTRPKNRKIEIE